MRVARYRSSPGRFGRLLDEAANVGSIDASARELDTGLLTLRDATLRKRGNELTGTARITEADLRSAVPTEEVKTLVTERPRHGDALLGKGAQCCARVAVVGLGNGQAETRDGEIVLEGRPEIIP